jgi:hypothetical protein
MHVTYTFIHLNLAYLDRKHTHTIPGEQKKGRQTTTKHDLLKTLYTDQGVANFCFSCDLIVCMSLEKMK